MVKLRSRKTRKKKREAFHVEKFNRERVSVYRRLTPTGCVGYMVANYSTGKRRLDSYSDADEAIEAARKLAKQLSERDFITATMTRDQAIEYASAVQALKPANVGLVAAATTIAEAIKIVGDLNGVVAAVKLAAEHNRTVKRKRVKEVVDEMIDVKRSRKASQRYLDDLNYRLNRFAEAFVQDACNVTTGMIQEWLDGLDLAPQSYTNYRRVLSVLFAFAKTRGYAVLNPVEAVEKVTAKPGEVTIFTPAELAKLLEAAKADFLPSLAIAAFAGLRSAEITRLGWSDVDLPGGHITVTAGTSKTASRRIVPIVPALADWLAPYAGRKGRVWPRTERRLYKRQQEAAAKAGIAWKHNALRHSFISYRLADVQDAAKVSLEAGNSPQMIFRHYRELVKPADALNWFNVRPKRDSNVVPLRTTA